MVSFSCTHLRSTYVRRFIHKPSRAHGSLSHPFTTYRNSCVLSSSMNFCNGQWMDGPRIDKRKMNTRTTTTPGMTYDDDSPVCCFYAINMLNSSDRSLYVVDIGLIVIFCSPKILSGNLGNLHCTAQRTTMISYLLIRIPLPATYLLTLPFWSVIYSGYRHQSSQATSNTLNR